MKKTLLLLAFAAFLPPFGAQAKSADPVAQARFITNPFPGACDNAVFLAKSSYEENKEFWDQVRGQCSMNVQVLPQDGIMNLLNYFGDKNDEAAGAAFLTKVAQRTIDNLEFNNSTSELWKYCAALGDSSTAEAAKKWFADKQTAAAELTQRNSAMGPFYQNFYDASKCADRLAELRDLIRKKGRDYRIARGVMRQAAGLDSMVWNATTKAVDNGIDAVNTSTHLGLENVILEGDKVPLSAEEKAAVSKAVTETTADFSKKLYEEGEREAARLLAFREKNPNANLETIDPPAAPWVVEYLKGGGGRGFQPQNPDGSDSPSGKTLPDGAQMALDSAVQQSVRLKLFNESYQTYAKTLGEARILGFLSQRDPSNADLMKAADRLLTNGKKDLTDVRDLIDVKGSLKIDLSGFGRAEATNQQKINQLSKILARAPVVQSLLQENPGDCRIAAGLTKYIAKLSTRDGAAIAVGGFVLAAASGGVGAAAFSAAGISVSAAAISSTVGMAMTGASLAKDYHSFAVAKRQAFTVAHTDKNTFGAGTNTTNLEAYQSARNAFIFSTAITMAELTGKGISAGYHAYLASRQANLDTGVVLSELMKDPEQGGLGLTESQARQTLKDLASSDPDKVREATGLVAKAMNVSESELDAFQQVVKKQLADPDTQPLFETFSNRLHAMKATMTPEERKQFVEQSKNIVNKMNAILANVDGVNPAKRADAARLLIAASEFNPGISGEELTRQATTVANNIKNWDEGLYGLARVYEQAKLNLALGLGYDEAFKKALQDFGVKDPLTLHSMLSCGAGISAN